MSHEDRHFDAFKIFKILFVLTAVEVLWGYMGGRWFEFTKFWLWGGLLLCAWFKAWYIAMYFMHLKFEGWVVKTLIVPTPFLILVIFGYVLPDVANKEGNLVHPLGSTYDPESGVVVREMKWDMEEQARLAEERERAERAAERAAEELEEQPEG